MTSWQIRFWYSESSDHSPNLSQSQQKQRISSRTSLRSFRLQIDQSRLLRWKCCNISTAGNISHLDHPSSRLGRTPPPLGPSKATRILPKTIMVIVPPATNNHTMRRRSLLLMEFSNWHCPGPQTQIFLTVFLNRNNSILIWLLPKRTWISYWMSISSCSVPAKFMPHRVPTSHMIRIPFVHAEHLLWGPPKCYYIIINRQTLLKKKTKNIYIHIAKDNSCWLIC